MPEQKTLKRAEADKRAGRASSTQAGEFVKEQIDKVRAGKHGVRSAKQAIAIGLSEARRAGVAVKSPKKGSASEATRKKAATDNAAGQHKRVAKKSAESTAKRSRASTNALKREGSAGASRAALSKQTKSAAARRPAASRSAAAKKAAATKGAAGRSAAAKKAAHTRASRAHH
ncbi:DUF6496 domain-containing protein [Paraburkholderia sp. BL21I4N1]|uniref:DUF6496 domain-containing protein n=1 Tax=Paraburkholderia sp. BL21I4N1 TaxID=1938801 RepID=UPI000CFDBB66|nr:DUF6496 domain-containing protein [Paraburkholderia sp. BL21I4N1]PQV54284.1 hypothetical protein B0G83_101466 [Paraburkholderia sp. BL21I4N1]